MNYDDFGSFLSIQNLTEELNAFCGQLGMPYTTIRRETVVSSSGTPLKRCLVLSTQGPMFDFSESRQLNLPNSEAALHVVNTMWRIQGSFESALPRAVEDFLAAFPNSRPSHWHAGTEILAIGSTLAFALDSQRLWPAWYFIGHEGDLRAAPTTRTRTVSKPSIVDLEEDVLGLHRSAWPSLFPAIAIVLEQDLIRISQNRIQKIDNTEAIRLGFEVGRMATTYLGRGECVLRYTLFGSERSPVGQDERHLALDDILYGISLPAKSGKEILSADIELRIGTTVIDWSRSAYIRRIDVQVGIVP